MCSHVFGSSQGSPKIALLLYFNLFYLSLYRTCYSQIVIYSYYLYKKVVYIFQQGQAS